MIRFVLEISRHVIPLSADGMMRGTRKPGLPWQQLLLLQTIPGETDQLIDWSQ